MGSVVLHGATLLVFVLHISAGALALVAGTTAAVARKGGPVHRLAGNVFFASMLVMATFAAVLAVVRPGQIINLFIAAFAFYPVATAWLAARRPDGVAGNAEKAALAVSLVLCAPFALVIFQVATGITVFKTAFTIEGAILVALCSFASVIALAAFGDARVVLAGGLSGRSRIARHLWRMCVGLTLATGSAFTNGFARFLPGPYHVPLVFFLPQFLPLVLLVYWMIRVRFAGWVERAPVAPTA
jgi:hypothetical protein